MYCSWYDPMAGSCECGNECSGFMKGRLFFGKMSDCQHQNKNSVP